MQASLARRERDGHATDRRSSRTCAGVHSLPVYTFTSLPFASTIAVRRLCVMFERIVQRARDRDAEAGANRSISSRSPVKNVHRDGSADELARVLLQNRRRVGDRVEADADEVHLLQRRVALDGLLDRREVPIHQRTERGKRARGVDERDGDRRPLERAEALLLAVLVDELHVRDGIAGLEQLESGRRRRCLRCGGFSIGAWPTFFTAVRYASFDTMTSVAFIRSPGATPFSRSGVLHLVGHRHRRHEALDLVVLDRRLLMVGGHLEDLALQRVAALRGW